VSPEGVRTLSSSTRSSPPASRTTSSPATAMLTAGVWISATRGSKWSQVSIT
jgi:hypothetical protein